MNVRRFGSSCVLASVLCGGGVFSLCARADLTVTNNLTLWLKADAGVTITGSGVSTWSDQSVVGHHANQTTDGYRPLVVSNALAGKPVIRFDGVNDSMSVAANSSAMITTTGYTTFVVFNPLSIKTDLSNPWLNASVFMDWNSQTWGIPVRNNAGVPTFYAFVYMTVGGLAVAPMTIGFS